FLCSLRFYSFFFCLGLPPPTPTLFPYTTLFRSHTSHRGFCNPDDGRQNHNSKNNGCCQHRLSVSAYSLCCSIISDHRYDHNQARSEEHTSELQSRFDLVCRLLLEKKKSPTRTKH